MHRALAAVLLLAALVSAAWADGVVVPGVAVLKPVRTPDQRALVRFNGTSETLVIETTLQGEGRDFAWILPLPAPPRIEASTTGLFPTLEVLTAPQAIDRGKGEDRSWVLLAALGVGLWRSIRFWRRPLQPGPALLVTPGLLAFALVYFVAGMGCGTATMKSVAAVPTPSVTVLARQQVGAFDTATLDARDPLALRQWLDANGFRAPDGIDPVVAAYAREGWVFVASKVRRDADDGAVRRIHPLAFTFPATEAVYPMRLTGTANDSVALELFVFGDRRAEATGLAVECCDERLLSRLGEKPTPYSQPHAELRRRTAGARVVTKLAGTLDRAAMSDDLRLRWTDFVPERRVLYSSGMALERALVPGAAMLALLLVAAAIVSRRRSGAAPLDRHDVRWIAAALLISAATVAGAWRLTPRLPEGTRVARWDRGPSLAGPPEATRGDAAALRGWAESVSLGVENAVTGEPVREEDSPGNWTVREIDGRTELVLVRLDPNGVEEEVVNASPIASIDGSVRSADGQPVPWAQVHVTRADTYGDVAPSRVLYERYSKLDVETGRDGRFALRVPAGRTWHLWVVAPDQPFLVRPSVALPLADGSKLDLVLPRERTIRGRALDSAGRPLPWAVVYAERNDTFGLDATKTATTAFDGTFEFRGFDADAAELTVAFHVHDPKHCDETQTLKLGPASPPVELRLRGN